jgi:hypothetical protein
MSDSWRFILFSEELPMTGIPGTMTGRLLAANIWASNDGRQCHGYLS